MYKKKDTNISFLPPIPYDSNYFSSSFVIKNWHTNETKLKLKKKYQFHTLYHYLAVFIKVVHELYGQPLYAN
jgi:hypothetical protein